MDAVLNPQAGHRWLMPVILATQEAAIRRIVVQNQSEQIVALLRNHPSQKRRGRAGGAAQGKGSEFKSQYLRKRNEAL
jgi:hypothetical protein